MTNTTHFIFTRFKILCLLGLLFLAGCGTVPSKDRHQIGLDRESFYSGDTVLGCSTLACAWTFNSKRNILLGLHQSRQWGRLASAVIALDFNQDLSYFYLAQSAEGLGKPVAALRYYRMSLENMNKCNGLINACDNFVLSELVPPRIRQLESKLEAEAERVKRWRASEIPAQPSSPATPGYQHPVSVSDAPQGSKKFSGPNVGTSGQTLLLRGWRAANGETLYQLYVAVSYFGSKRNYSSSVDGEGVTLRFTPTATDSKNCDGDKCQITEHIAITLPRSYLTEHRIAGIDLSLKHDSGFTRIYLNALYVQDFLAQTP